IDVVNSLSLLTAKPVTYLVNLSEADYIGKKNKPLAHPSFPSRPNLIHLLLGSSRSKPGSTPTTRVTA
ncbi:hypothetical protein C0991_002016, partial [Blastosporella zonata]